MLISPFLSPTQIGGITLTVMTTMDLYVEELLDPLIHKLQLQLLFSPDTVQLDTLVLGKQVRLTFILISDLVFDPKSYFEYHKVQLRKPIMR